MLPVVELYREVAVEESIAIGVAVLKLVLGDTEVDVGLSVLRVITSAAGEEGSISVGFDPERYGRGVMKNKSVKSQVLHLSIEPQSSVVGGIWVVLLTLLTLGSTPEINCPVSLVSSSTVLSSFVLPLKIINFTKLDLELEMSGLCVSTVALFRSSSFNESS